MHHELNYWKNTAAGALKQSGELMANAGEKASNLVQRAFRQAHEAYPRVERIYPRLASSATTIGRQARGRLYSLSNAARSNIHDTSLEIAGGVRHAAKLSLWFGGIYMAVKLFCSKESRGYKARVAVEEHIRAEPVESALIAAGLGYVIGRLLRW